jgi:chromosome segregation ATPase
MVKEFPMQLGGKSESARAGESPKSVEKLNGQISEIAAELRKYQESGLAESASSDELQRFTGLINSRMEKLIKDLEMSWKSGDAVPPTTEKAVSALMIEVDRFAAQSKPESVRRKSAKGRESKESAESIDSQITAITAELREYRLSEMASGASSEELQKFGASVNEQMDKLLRNLAKGGAEGSALPQSTEKAFSELMAEIEKFQTQSVSERGQSRFAEIGESEFAEELPDQMAGIEHFQPAHRSAHGETFKGFGRFPG